MSRHPDGVWVNLAFSRDTPWARLISFEPYRGELRLEVRQAAPFFLRLPEWADRDQVQFRLDGDTRPVHWNGRYLVLGAITPGQTVVVTYPQRQREMTETIASGDYETHWKGGTVTTIRPTGGRYPIYERVEFETTEPPMIERAAVVRPVVVTW